MAMHYGVPSFFTTFTAAENLWSDMQQACGNAHHAERPVDSTRQYHHRFDTFNSTFLKAGTVSPVGTIARTWWRQEEQGRGSLHVHMATWIEGSLDEALRHASQICGTAPRNCATDEEHAWRQFVLNVQRHDCRPKCMTKGGVAIDHCKYLYPRPIYAQGSTVFPAYNSSTDRYNQACFEPEDARLSPYVPLWLLAWGGSMNIQYCTGSGFLSYIAKYICKPEPHGALYDNAELRQREKETSPFTRYLNARILGAPEAIYRALGYQLQLGAPVVHVPTNLPEWRTRSLLLGAERARRAS